MSCKPTLYVIDDYEAWLLFEIDFILLLQSLHGKHNRVAINNIDNPQYIITIIQPISLNIQLGRVVQEGQLLKVET